MSAQEVADQIISRIAPQLNELGADAFLLMAYVNDGEGNVRRIVIGNGGKNQGYQDGMKPMLHFAAKWESGEL